jgi:predicted ferric reductase
VPSARALLIWSALAAAILVPVAVATTSPYLDWRGPVYIGAGFAGILALGLMLLQPLLAAGYLPGLPPRPGRRVHLWLGVALVVLVLLHVVGLYLTSPPDALDALLFRSPTPFSIWGVLAMWAVFLSALLAIFRLRGRLSPRFWRLAHTALALVIVVGTVLHALYVDGAMEMITKAGLCLLLLFATFRAVIDLRAWALLRRRPPPPDRR